MLELNSEKKKLRLATAIFMFECKLQEKIDQNGGSRAFDFPDHEEIRDGSYLEERIGGKYIDRTDGRFAFKNMMYGPFVNVFVKGGLQISFNLKLFKVKLFGTWRQMDVNDEEEDRFFWELGLRYLFH